MKLKKKSLVLSLLSILLLTGCNPELSSDDQSYEDNTADTLNPVTTPTTIKMSLMNSTNENPGWEAMIDKANELMARDGANVTIEKEIIKTDSWDEYYTKVSSNMAGKIGGTIGRIAESHIPGMIKKNQLQDLSAIRNILVQDTKYNADAFEGVAKEKGSYWGLPSGTQHMVLYYNKDKFDAKDISYPSSDWNNPSTFAEIKEKAVALTSGEGAARQFGLSAAPFLAYAGMYAVNSGGENIFNAEGECIIKSDPYYNVYEWFDEMLKDEHCMPRTSDTATSSAIDRFLSGNIAMMVDGVWQMRDIVKYTEFNVGVAAIPVYSSGITASSTTFTDRFFAVRSSKTPDADKIAIKYLMSVEAITAVAEKQVGGFPIHSDVVDTYTSSLRKSKISDYVECITEGTQHSVNVPYSTYYNTVDQRINQKMAPWINGDMTGREFVDYMDETMKKGMAGNL